MTVQVCVIAGCERPAHARGWCGTHYTRWHKFGDPTQVTMRHYQTRSDEERFWAKVDKSGDCWLWTARINSCGYGTFSARANGWVPRMAHRLAYEYLIGPIPVGLQLDHLCRNRACVNPEHCEPVTGRENTLRGVTLAAANAAKTHCIRGHEFTPENTNVGPSGARRCRTCSALRQRKYRRKKALT